MPEQYNPLNDHAEFLKSFWNVYGGDFRWKKSPHSRNEVIAGLTVAGTKSIFYSLQGRTPELRRKLLEKNRAKFDRVKDIRQRYKFKPGYECLACGELPNVRHHIIWLKNGGRNCKRNICYLCNRCHADIHPWLKHK